MTERLDAVVIGAGVIGLAVGRSLALDGREVIVLEAEPGIGMHSSSRNSEVIHAGIYYPEDSRKARLCVQGKKMLYTFCEGRGIPHQRIGKLIVAVDESDRGKLEEIRTRGSRNGVDDLQMLDRQAAAALEPSVSCVAALYSPSTGIVDSHTFMLALEADIESQGGAVVPGSRVTDIRLRDDGFGFSVGGEAFSCRTLVNAAGLWATQLAIDICGDAAPTGSSRPWAAPEAAFAKGHYFTYAGKSPFRHLVYPLPTGGGLGIHATNDLAGTARFGPDVTWIDDIDYTFDESRKADFVEAIAKYYRDLDPEKLAPGYTGIRPKLHGPGEPAADFAIVGERGHGIPNLVHLLGIESPGLTASLAIGDYVRDLVR